MEPQFIQPVSSKRPSKKRIVLIAIGAVIVCAGITLAILFLLRPQSQSAETPSQSLTLTKSFATTNQINFSWTPVTQGATYTLECADNKDFTGTVITSQSMASPASCSGLTGDTTYFARLRENDGDWTKIVEVTTAADVPVPTGIRVTTVQKDQISLRWNAVPNTSSYDIQAATDQNFVDVLATLSSTDPEVTFQGLEPATTYYFRVRVQPADRVGSLAPYSLFTNGTTIAN